MRSRLHESAQKARQHALHLAVVPGGNGPAAATTTAAAAAARQSRTAIPRAGPVIVKARTFRDRPWGRTRPNGPAPAKRTGAASSGVAVMEAGAAASSGRGWGASAGRVGKGSAVSRGGDSRRRRNAEDGGARKSNSNKNDDDDVADYVDTHRREVGRFGSEGLEKRDKRSYQTAQLVKLGCKPPKNPKMPIGLLQRVRQRQRDRDQEKKEMDRATGMLVRSRRKR